MNHIATTPRPPAHSTTFVQLASGFCVDLLAPDLAELRLTDIAIGLARLPRFNGATRTPRAYTVAQHSVFVMQLVMRETENIFLHRAALLHDAHEALMGDIATPVKALLGRERVAEAERRLAAPLFTRFGLQHGLFDAPVIHAADRMALSVEKATLLARPAWPWGQDLPTPANAALWPTEIWDEGWAYAQFLSAVNLVGLR